MYRPYHANIEQRLTLRYARDNHPIEETVTARTAIGDGPAQSKELCAETDVVCDDMYHYSVLLNNDIRLLKLQESDDTSGNMNAELFHVPLHLAQTLNYVALSYTWGSSNDLKRIMVNDCAMCIRTNAFQILDRLKALGCLIVWVSLVTDRCNKAHADSVIDRFHLY